MVEKVFALLDELEIEPTFVDTRNEFFSCISDYKDEIIDVKGQENVKRAMEVAAAGGHNLLMIYIILLFNIQYYNIKPSAFSWMAGIFIICGARF